MVAEEEGEIPDTVGCDICQEVRKLGGSGRCPEDVAERESPSP